MRSRCSCNSEFLIENEVIFKIQVRSLFSQQMVSAITMNTNLLFLDVCHPQTS